MNISKRLLYAASAGIIAAIVTGCFTVKYSLSGASIHPDARTVSIAYFQNNAAMISPTLSPTLTDGLQDRFARQTKLEQVPEDGDLSFEGEIINYTYAPSSIGSSGSTEFAQMNRVTVTVRVKFENKLEPALNFNRNFSTYQDYNADRMLLEVEPEIIPAMVEILVEDIFNAAVANW